MTDDYIRGLVAFAVGLGWLAVNFKAGTDWLKFVTLFVGLAWLCVGSAIVARAVLP